MFIAFTKIRKFVENRGLVPKLYNFYVVKPFRHSNTELDGLLWTGTSCHYYTKRKSKRKTVDKITNLIEI